MFHQKRMALHWQGCSSEEETDVVNSLLCSCIVEAA